MPLQIFWSTWGVEHLSGAKLFRSPTLVGFWTQERSCSEETIQTIRKKKEGRKRESETYKKKERKRKKKKEDKAEMT
jgi:hypothetical protein